LSVSEGAAKWTPKQRMKELPRAVAWMVMGAVEHEAYKGVEGVRALELDGDFMTICGADWEDVVRVHGRVREAGLGSALSGKEALRCYRMAAGMVPSDDAKKRVAMLKDRSGSGYWRMVLPATQMEEMEEMKSVVLDVTAAHVEFDSLLEYDTVFVQRLHDWDSYYVLKRLCKAGVRVVYDMDDDIFSLTPDNPAFHVISRDNQMAARECMKLADVVTTTTEELARRLGAVCDGEVYPVVVPNAMRTDGWVPTELTGSPDGIKRVFWQGSSTHEADWEVCIEGVDAVLASRDDVRLVILGCLPQAVQSRLALPHWKGKVEFMGFTDAETYFQIVKHLRAEVGLAPLVASQFNQAKSPIKWMENALIGMPTVASACLPYSEVIEDGVSGRLVGPDPEMWRRAIEGYLDDKRCRLAAVAASRRLVVQEYDIEKVAHIWKTLLLP